MSRHSLLTLAFLVLVLSAPRVGAPQLSRGPDPANMGPGVSPCTDLYQYAVGGWEQRTTILAEYGKYGVDQEVDERTATLLKAILEDAAADTSAPRGSERQKVGDFSAAGMEAARIEAEGWRPLEPFMVRIAAIWDRRGLASAIALLQEIGTAAAFGVEVGPDDRSSASS